MDSESEIPNLKLGVPMPVLVGPGAQPGEALPVTAPSIQVSSTTATTAKGQIRSSESQSGSAYSSLNLVTMLHFNGDTNQNRPLDQCGKPKSIPNDCSPSSY